MTQIPVIFENDEIFVINKPAGVAVQGGEGIAHPLDEEFSKQVGFKVYLVHRLDKETSGLMVVAKNPKAASKWIELIASKQVQKEYTAVCFGEPLINGKKQKTGTISGRVVKKNGRNEREQAAVTNFTVEEVHTVEIPLSSENPEEGAEKLFPITFSKIHLKLGTGRMHQIRIHLASVGRLRITLSNAYPNKELGYGWNLQICDTKGRVLKESKKIRTKQTIGVTVKKGTACVVKVSPNWESESFAPIDDIYLLKAVIK